MDRSKEKFEWRIKDIIKRKNGQAQSKGDDDRKVQQNAGKCKGGISGDSPVQAVFQRWQASQGSPPQADIRDQKRGQLVPGCQKYGCC